MIPDIVITNTIVIPLGAVVAWLIGCPHIWIVNEYGELDHKLKFFLPFQEITNFICKSSDKVITCSKAVRDSLFPNLCEAAIDTIYYYIEMPEKRKPMNCQTVNIILCQLDSIINI
jgi:hypothetical protein